MRGVLRKVDERARLVAAYRASGLSARAFAEGEGIPASTLYQWLKGDARRPVGLRMAKVVPPTANSVEEKQHPTPAVTIEVGAACVRVAPGFDRSTLKTVLELLSEGTRGGRQ